MVKKCKINKKRVQESLTPLGSNKKIGGGEQDLAVFNNLPGGLRLGID